MKKNSSLCRPVCAIAIAGFTFANPAVADDHDAIQWSGKMFAHWGIDLTEANGEGAGYAEGDTRPNAFDIKRVYLTAKKKLDKDFSIRVTTDVGRTNDRKLELFLKNAYLQYKVNSDIKLRFGASATAWVPHTDKIWGHRYIAKGFANQEQILDTADLGVQALGSHSDGLITWQAGLLNGDGYSNPEIGPTKALQTRITVDPLAPGGDSNLPIGVFVSQDMFVPEAEEGMTIIGAGTGWKGDPATVWAEYFRTSSGELVGSGYSATAVGHVGDVLNVLVRYDSWDPDADTDEDAHTVLRGGASKDFNKYVSAALTYERTEMEAAPDEPAHGVFVRMQAKY